MSLTDTKIRNTKPSTSPFKLTDAHGLYLLINPGGSRLWYLKYRFNSKESRIALGPYPQVFLSEARQQREGIRKLLTQNINPTRHRANERIARSPDKCLKSWRWNSIKAEPIKNGLLIMPLVCLPV